MPSKPRGFTLARGEMIVWFEYVCVLKICRLLTLLQSQEHSCAMQLCLQQQKLEQPVCLGRELVKLALTFTWVWPNLQSLR